MEALKASLAKKGESAQEKEPRKAASKGKPARKRASKAS